MRIAKFIASCGVCSRRDAEKLITEGKVKVNGHIITTPATILLERDTVEVSDKLIQAAEKPRLWLYYKPIGLVTSHRDELGRPTVFESIQGLPRVISVGRLDLNSEGLLLLTNSGELARRLELPSSKFDRIYKVRAFGDPRSILSSGKKFQVDGVDYSFKSIKLLTPNKTNIWFEVILQEGKNREIRRVFEHFGLQVSRLIRTNYACYSLGNLEPGALMEVEIKHST